MTNNDRITALDRGIQVIEHLLAKEGEASYSEIKQLFNGITDASLDRLLRALGASGCVNKISRGAYVLGARPIAWKNAVLADHAWETKIKHCVYQINEATGESAALAVLEDDRLRIAASRSVIDSISIIPAGSILHFEEDHAGSLAVLHNLPAEERARLISSAASRIDSIRQLENAIHTFSFGSFFADKSSLRVGVSRLSVFVSTVKGPGSVFVCGPSERIHTNKNEYYEILKTKAGELIDSAT